MEPAPRPSLIPMTVEEDMGVEDDDMLLQTQHPHQFDDDDIETSGRVQSPPPVTTQLARTLGMPSQRVQIMKASFFDSDDIMVDESMAVGSFLGASRTPQQPSLFSRKMDMSLTLKHSQTPSPRSLFKSHAMPTTNDQTQIFAKTQFMELDQSLNVSVSKIVRPAETDVPNVDPLAGCIRLEHGLKPSDKVKKIVPRFSSAEVALKHSLMDEKFHVLTDAALFQNRSFRVGWAPNLHLTELDAPHSSSVSLSVLETSEFQSSDDQNDNVERIFQVDSRNPCVALLSTYLNFTKRTVIGGVPMLQPSSGSEAVASMRLATEDLITRLKQSGNSRSMELLAYMLKVWKLCIALWGPLEEEVGEHAQAMARKEALSHWLEEAAAETDIIGLEDEEEVCIKL